MPQSPALSAERATLTGGEIAESGLLDAAEPGLSPLPPPSNEHPNGAKSKVSRNIAATAATQLFSWAMTFVVMLYLNWWIEAKGLGKMGQASGFLAVFSVLIPFGTSQVLVKEIARRIRPLGELLTLALCLRGALFLCMGALAAAIGPLMYDNEIYPLILVGIIGMPIMAANDACNAALQGREELPKQNLFSLVDRLVYSCLVLGMIYLKVNPLTHLWLFVAAAPIAGMVQLTLHLWNLRGKWQGAKLPRLPDMRALALLGGPFLGWSVFQTLYGMTDTVVLGKVVNDHAVAGWYQLAFRLIGTTLFFPMAIATALLPTLARLHTAGDSEAFRRIARKGLEIVLLIGVPLAVLFAVAAGPVIAILRQGPSYAGAVPVLQFGGLSCLMYFAGCMLGTLVNAIDQQKQMFRITMIVAIVGIPRCIVASWLAQKYWGNGAVGAIFSGAILEVFMVYSYLRILPPGLFGAETVRKIVLYALAALPMAGLLWLISARGWSLYLIVLCPILYLVGLIVLRAVDRSDFETFRDIFRRRAA